MMRIAFTAAVGVGVLASAAHGALLVNSFESGIGGVTVNNPAQATVSLNTYWATDGVQSLKATNVSGGAPWVFISLSSAQYAALYQDRAIQLDYMIDNLQPANSWASGKFMLQSDLGGWQELPGASIVNYNRDGGSYTLIGDFTPMAMVENSGSWRRVGLTINGDGGYDMNIDNVQVVPIPEPVSLGAMLLGAAGLLARRRQV